MFNLQQSYPYTVFFIQPCKWAVAKEVTKNYGATKAYKHIHRICNNLNSNCFENVIK